MSPKKTAKPRRVFRCSFCGKPQTEVKALVAGPGVFICDECIPVAADAAAPNLKKKGKGGSPKSLPDHAPTKTLLGVLAGYGGAFERIDNSMQDLVMILRRRGVKWEAIGQTLGVTRQAAWKRFG